MKHSSYLAVAAVAVITFGTYSLLIGDEPAAAINPNTIPLQIERAKVVAEFGPKHPRVKVLDAQIKGVAKLPVESSIPDVAKMTDAELRATVRNLIGRVDSLERDVSDLKARKPRTELLGR